MKRTIIIMTVILLCGKFSAGAQQYTGNAGLIHVPAAEMDAPATARLGGHYFNKQFTLMNRQCVDYYLAFTPYKWLTMSYVASVWKLHNPTIYHQDRHISVKALPLQERKWRPAVAIGVDDPAAVSNTAATQYFANYYVALSKHMPGRRGEIGLHLAYRHYFKRDSRWEGVIGGLTYRPYSAKNLRLIAEYTGHEVNVGADCLLWKHLFLQASLQGGKYVQGGLCFLIDLN